jgi:hypothetical protein
MNENNHVKVLFRFYSNILDEERTETMWTTIVDKEKGYYKLDNIPFYAELIAIDDVVFAEYDEDESMLTYRKTVEFSGNSTIHVILMNDVLDINNIRKTFEDMDCESEKLNGKYFAMDIPARVDYKFIKLKLDELEKDEIIGYAETCLSERHKY